MSLFASVLVPLLLTGTTAAAQPAVKSPPVLAHTAVQRAAMADPLVRAYVAGEVDPRGLAVDPSSGALYWSEYTRERIRRLPLGAATAETVIEARDLDPLDTPRVGPTGLAIDVESARLFWTTEAGYPRRVLSATLDGEEIEELIGGEDVNRPTAIAVDARAERLFWTEFTSGRLRVANLDGSDAVELVRQQRMAAFGLAIDADAGQVYWTEYDNARIRRADTDGTGVVDVAVPSDAVVAPWGLGFDHRSARLVWADSGSARILSASLDGSDLRTLVGPDQGLVAPAALALDVDRDRLYWSDRASHSLWRSRLDGSEPEAFLSLAPPFVGPLGTLVDALAADPGGLACSSAVRSGGERYVRRVVQALRVCLEKVDLAKAVKWHMSHTAVVAPACAASLRSIGVAEDSAGTIRAEFDAALDEACAAFEGDLEVADADADADADDGASCTTLDSTAPDGLRQWRSCVIERHLDFAHRIVAATIARPIEWMQEIEPFFDDLPVSTTDPNGAAVAHAVVATFVNAMRALAPPLETAGSAVLTRTGQLANYAADRNDGKRGAVALADDGAVQAGRPPNFIDNGDGTVTDRNTGLMWEKKCDGCRGLHDVGNAYPWSADGKQDTVWDWIEDLNREDGRGFAGYSDWRLPNARELQSLIDYGRFNPAVGPAFDADDCGRGCGSITDPACSCTRQSYYWSSTTFADFPAHGVVVGFHLPLVGDRVKTDRSFVRAVRGGL